MELVSVPLLDMQWESLSALCLGYLSEVLLVLLKVQVSAWHLAQVSARQKALLSAPLSVMVSALLSAPLSVWLSVQTMACLWWVAVG
jgi:hypothetical protein